MWLFVLYRFKGTREGGISENASFFIFMQCTNAKTFEAYPIDEWYSFAPQVKYRYLDIDEAEDEYNKYGFLYMWHSIDVNLCLIKLMRNKTLLCDFIIITWYRILVMSCTYDYCVFYAQQYCIIFSWCPSTSFIHSSRQMLLPPYLMNPSNSTYCATLC